MKDGFALIPVVWSDWETRNVADRLWMSKGESGRMETELGRGPNEWGLINWKHKWMGHETLEADTEEGFNILLQLGVPILRIKSDWTINSVISKYTSYTELASTLPSSKQKQQEPRLGNGKKKGAALTTAYKQLNRRVAELSPICSWDKWDGSCVLPC